MPFKDGHHLRYERLQAFAAYAATDAPDFRHGANGIAGVCSLATSTFSMAFWNPLAQLPDSVLAMTARRRHKLIENAGLLRLTRLKIARVSPLGQLILTLLAHDMLPYFVHATDSNIFYEATL